MNKKNYELYQKHKSEIFEMLSEVYERAPIMPFLPTEEDKKKYAKEMKIFSESENPKILEKLKLLGFELHKSERVV